MATGGGRLRTRQGVGIALIAVGLSVVLHLTSTSTPLSRELLTRLSYLAIVVAALWGGTGAGLGVAVLASALYLPHVVAGLHAWSSVGIEQYGEVALFLVVGAVAGHFSRPGRGGADRALEASRQSAALARLRVSLEERLTLDRRATVGRIATGMAHEVGDALAVARGALEILGRPEVLPPRGLEFTSIAQDAISRASQALDDLLEFAQPVLPEMRETDLGRLAGRMARAIGPALSARQVEIVGPTLPLDPVVVVVDTEQLRRALTTLFLEAPAIVGARRVGVSVASTGEMATLALDLTGDTDQTTLPGPIFEPFVDRRVGHGLGLALAQRLVENQGGTVHALQLAERVRIAVDLPRARSEHGTHPGEGIDARLQNRVLESWRHSDSP